MQDPKRQREAYRHHLRSICTVNCRYFTPAMCADSTGCKLHRPWICHVHKIPKIQASWSCRACMLIACTRKKMLLFILCPTSQIGSNSTWCIFGIAIFVFELEVLLQISQVKRLFQKSEDWKVFFDTLLWASFAGQHMTEKDKICHIVFMPVKTCTTLSRLDFCCTPWKCCFGFKYSFPDWNRTQCKTNKRLLQLSIKSTC